MVCPFKWYRFLFDIVISNWMENNLQIIKWFERKNGYRRYRWLIWHRDSSNLKGNNFPKLDLLIEIQLIYFIKKENFISWAQNKKITEFMYKNIYTI